jgi:hypothetical protein
VQRDHVECGPARSDELPDLAPLPIFEREFRGAEALRNSGKRQQSLFHLIAQQSCAPGCANSAQLERNMRNWSKASDSGAKRPSCGGMRRSKPAQARTPQRDLDPPFASTGNQSCCDAKQRVIEPLLVVRLRQRDGAARAPLPFARPTGRRAAGGACACKSDVTRSRTGQDVRCFRSATDAELR